MTELVTGPGRQGVVPYSFITVTDAIYEYIVLEVT